MVPGHWVLRGPRLLKHTEGSASVPHGPGRLLWQELLPPHCSQEIGQDEEHALNLYTFRRTFRILFYSENRILLFSTCAMRDSVPGSLLRLV